jgi:tetratricopeptide (TPR) repeat protein
MKSFQDDADFDSLYEAADARLQIGRYGDASRLFQRALLAEGGTKGERYWARLYKARCDEICGFQRGALGEISEVLSATQNDPDFVDIAYSAMFLEVACLRDLHYGTHPSMDPAFLRELLELVNSRIEWVQVAAPHFSAAALKLEKARTLMAIGEYELALDSAEDSLHSMLKMALEERGYEETDHVEAILQASELAGSQERATEILEESYDKLTAGQMYLDEWWVKMFREAKPSRLIEALELLRRHAATVKQIQARPLRISWNGNYMILALETGCFDEAEEALLEIYASASKSHIEERYRCLRMALDRVDAAINYLSTSAGKRSNKIWDRLNETRTSLEKAVTEFDAAVGLTAAQRTNYHNARANARCELGDYLGAFQHYTAASNHAGRAGILELCESHEDGLVEIQKAIDTAPEDSDNNYWLAGILSLKLNNLTAALEYFSKLVQADANDPLNYYWRALAHINDANWDHALADFDLDAALFPGDPVTKCYGLMWRGVICDKQGKSDEANIFYSEAITAAMDMKKDDGAQSRALAFANLVKGDAEQARVHFGDAIQSNRLRHKWLAARVYLLLLKRLFPDRLDIQEASQWFDEGLGPVPCLPLPHESGLTGDLL